MEKRRFATTFVTTGTIRLLARSAGAATIGVDRRGVPIGIMNATSKPAVLELSYLGEVIGWIDHASAFNPANEDDLYKNAAVLERFAA